MNDISFRGVSVSSMTGVAVQKMPSHKKAASRFTEYSIPGRDGTVHINEGYDSIELIAYLILTGANASARQLVNAWADGTGKLILSDDTTKCYIGSVLKGVEWNRDEVGGVYYDTAKIVFKCDPYMYEATDRQETITTDTNLLNLGDAVSRPLITVYGTGDVGFAINNKQVEITEMELLDPVTIDAETGYVYTANGSATMIGDVPELAIGTNSITLGDNVDRLVINPRWRWI